MGIELYVRVENLDLERLVNYLATAYPHLSMMQKQSLVRQAGELLKLCDPVSYTITPVIPPDVRVDVDGTPVSFAGYCEKSPPQDPETLPSPEASKP